MAPIHSTDFYFSKAIAGNSSYEPETVPSARPEGPNYFYVNEARFMDKYALSVVSLIELIF
jgi:hypothetical protein